MNLGAFEPISRRVDFVLYQKALRYMSAPAGLVWSSWAFTNGDEVLPGELPALESFGGLGGFHAGSTIIGWLFVIYFLPTDLSFLPSQISVVAFTSKIPIG